MTSGNPWVGRDRPLIIAHRGHSIAVPENTLEAYRRAIELGAEMIECDVNRTKDGELVMIHDWTLDRTTSGSGRVEESTLVEIRDLDAGSSFDPSFAGLRIPTTAETLDLAREAGILMCFEVKGETPEHFRRVAEQLVELFIEKDALAWAFMSSYDHEALAAAKAKAPELMLAPERLPDHVPVDLPEALRQAEALGAEVLQNHWRYVSRELVDTLHADDVALWTWPTTEDEGIIRSLDAGVDGVMGDDVSAMVRLVGERFGSPA
ncbi:MAG TPA: glycerophosphodiester phosphodiesterase family protein [Candidatus Limnocylindrales bacterium]|nr:glycerophosphodiester phosphodiesterase family protein [Candidatus Limnocylindrales bacterium]